VAVDGAGNVYVTDSGNSTIRKITPAGAVSTVAGTARSTGDLDGVGAAASFDSPQGIVVDSMGNVFIADGGNNGIRKAALIVPINITSQPQSQTLNSGSTVVLTGVISGALSYQWNFNGAPLSDGPGSGSTDVISGATGPQLVITSATAASDGNYTLTATNATSSNTSNGATLQVVSSFAPGLATSISTRAFVGTGDNILIGGFYVVGSTSRTVLIQALGPALTPLGVSGALQHPTVSIHQTQNGQDVTLYSNTGWGSSPVLLNAAASVFASPTLMAGSADSELLVTLPPGGYSAEVSGADGGTGVALCAIYELP
jgi:hypothetical protein